MSSLKKMSMTAFAGIAVGMFGASALAVEPFDRDVEIARKLNEMQMYSYAEFHINALLKDNPGNAKLIAQQVDNLLATKKTDEAMKLAESIPNDSEGYYLAQEKIGNFQATKLNNLPAACATMNKIFIYVKTKNDPAVTKRFEGALKRLIMMFNNNGDVQPAMEVRAFMQKQSETAKMTKEERRNMNLDDAKFILASIDSMKKKQKERTEFLNNLVKTKVDEARAAGKANLDKVYSDAMATDNPYYAALNTVKEADIMAKGAAREKAWLAFAKEVGISDAEIKEYMVYREIANQQPRRLTIMRKSTDLLSLNEMTYMNHKNALDWQDETYNAMLKCEDVLWGGLDVLTAYAVAEYFHACYHLKFYDKAFTYMRKYKRLFEDCDRAFAKSDLGISHSPTADEKVWEGYLCEAYAEKLETDAAVAAKSKDAKKAAEAEELKKESMKYYQRAFVAFGKYLKTYREHPQIAATYPEFIKVSEKIIALKPSIEAKLQAQIDSVPKPAKKVATGKEEDLITALAESEYKAGVKLLGDIQKLERARKKVDPKSYAELQKHFRTVVDELLPILSIAKRNSDGLPKLFQYIIYSYGMVIDQPGTEDFIMLNAISELGTYLFENDDFGGPQVASAQFLAGYSLFGKSQKMIRSNNKALAVTGEKLKDEAFVLLKQYLASKAMPKANACDAAITLARDMFMTANRLGKEMNEKKSKVTADEFFKLNKERIATFDEAIRLYEYAKTTFRPEDKPDYQDEIYERVAEAYQVTDRFEEAIKMNEEFCAKGSRVPFKIVSARNNIVMFLYQLAGIHDGKANDLDNELKLLIAPVEPAKPDLKAIDAEYAKKIRDAGKAKSAAPAAVSADAKASAAAPAKPTAESLEKECEAAKAKAQADYEADMKNYEQAKTEFETQSAQLSEDLKKERELAAAYFERTIKELNSQLEPMLNSVITGKGMSQQYQQLQAKNPKQFADDKAKIEKMQVNVDTIRPWIYIGAGNLFEAAKAFELFIQTYENNAEMKAKIPSYYLQLADIYTSLAAEDAAKSVQYSDLAKAKLDVLSTKYKDTPQGRNAKFSLFKNLFKRKDYVRAKAALDEIFNSPELKANLSVNDFRWLIAEIGKMETAKGEFNRYVVTCCVDLISKLRQKNINAEEWVGKQMSARFAKNPAEFDTYFKNVEELLLMNIAQAYLEMKAYEEAEKSFTQLEKLDPKTPFFYRLYGGRADARIALGKTEKAKADLRKVAARANLSGELSKYYTAQTKLCRVLEDEAAKMPAGEEKTRTLEEAFGNYMIFTFPYTADKAPEAVSAGDEGPANFEFAMFKSVELCKQFDPGKVKVMKSRYLKLYPNGKFVNQVKAIDDTPSK